MSETSIICLRKDLDRALEALDNSGNFHIQETKETPGPTRFQQSIRRTKEIIGKLDTAIDRLEIEKSTFLDIFKEKTPLRKQITVEDWQSLARTVEEETSKLELKLDSLEASLKALDEEVSRLTQLRGVLATLDRFKIDVSVLEQMRFIYVVVARAPTANMYELGKALSTYPATLYQRSAAEETDFVFVAAPSKNKDEIEKILKTHHAEVFQIPQEIPRKTSQGLEEVNDRLEKALENRKAIMRSLENFAEANGHRLLALRETAQNILKVLSAKEKSLETKRLVAIEGYVPKRELSEVRTKLDHEIGGRVLVLEKEFAASEDPPTMIRNPSFVKPFEAITRLYGVAHYNELDPTPLVAITFPLIFGLMFGDIGHGLVLTITGAVLASLIKKDEGLRNLSLILAACGAGAIFSGLLFGEFFGKHTFAPLWFDPFEDVTGFLVFSLFVGIIQIMSGFALDFANFISKGNIIDAFTTSLPKILFYVGSLYLILVYQLNFELWLEGPILFALIPFIFLILGKIAVVKTSRALGHLVNDSAMHDSLLERFFETADLVTRLLSNTMSYARILALLMAHWALLLVTYVVSNMVSATPVFGTALAILIVVGGNIFVIAFEGLIVFIHTLRLHFYEWFSKFYQGTGVEFSPFKQSYVYTKIVFAR